MAGKVTKVAAATAITAGILGASAGTASAEGGHKNPHIDSYEQLVRHKVAKLTVFATHVFAYKACHITDYTICLVQPTAVD